MFVAGVSTRTKIVLAFAFLYLVWGSTYLGIRLCVQEMPPLLFAGARNGLAGLLTLMGAFLLLRAPLPDRRQTLDAAVMGFFLFFGGNGGVAWAEQTIPSGVAALLLGTTPFWMVTLHRLLHRGAPLHRGAWLGIAIGFVGILLLADPLASSAASLDKVGCLVVFLSSVSWSLGSVWGSRRDLPESPFVSAGIQMVSGGVALLALSVLTGDAARFDGARVTSTGIVAFWYLVLFGTIAGYMAFYYVLRRTPPHVTSSYSYVNPVVAVFLGTVFLDEPLGWRTLAATACIVGGVALMLWCARAWAPADEGH
jgi:drug/metabolite transporter (DMT)-like permease